MIEQIKAVYRYLFVMGAGAVLLMLATLVPVLSTTADFSIYNSGWNGCSSLGLDVYSTGSFLPSIDISSSSEEKVVHTSLSGMRGKLDPAHSSIMIIGPQTEFTPDECAFAHDYLASGGIIFLSDDFGSGNSLLSRLDTTTRIDQSMMLDLSYMKKAEFAVTYDTEPHPITKGVGSILMNYPSVVKPAPYARSLINSSISSWLNIDGDNITDDDEERGPFNILSIERYGEGELIVLSDPSLLINQMKSKMDNGILVGNIIDYLTANRSTLLIDESHRDLTDPVHLMDDFVGGLNVPYKMTALTFLLAVFVLVQTPLPRRIVSLARRGIDALIQENKELPPSLEEMISSIMKDNPAWDEKVLRQLVKDSEG